MGNLPTPEEIRAEEKRRDLQKHPSFGEMLNTLPLRQQKLVLLMLTEPNMSLTERAKKAGYKVTNGNVSSIYNKIEGKLGPALFDMGIRQHDLLRIVQDAMSATKPIIVRSGDESKVVDVPDHALRLKAAEMILKLGNYFPQATFKGEVKHKHEHTVKPIHEQVKDKTTAELLEIKKRYESGGEIQAEFEVVDARTTSSPV